MKIISKFKLTCTFLVMIFMLSISSCEKYLDKTPDSDLTVEDVFGSYENAQGYMDKNYCFIWDHMSYRAGTFMGYGDDFVASNGGVEGMALGAMVRYFTYPEYYSSFYDEGDRIWNDYWRYDHNNTNYGKWPSAWIQIRDCNFALENLELMKDATQEERDLIEGQALWFRAYHYYILLINWGGMPYVEKVLRVDDDPFLPRLNTWETIEQIVEDCDRAAQLLPDDWNNTVVGGEVVDANVGRLTKGAAIGLKTKALLCAGSPTFVKEATGVLRYDDEYLTRCAQAAWDLIQLANTGVYNLVPFEDYYKQFGRNDGFIPWSDETIIACVNWVKPGYGVGRNNFIQNHGRNLNPQRFGDQAVTACVTQNIVDMYEMENGLPIDDPGSGYDPMDPWSNRDPRFRGSILVDGDIWTIADPEENKFKMFVGGKDYGTEFQSPYILKKYWPLGCNVYDEQMTLYTASSPFLRLAEVYLIYAEAVNEVFGPTATLPGASLTAADAVNVVRQRPGLDMPSVDSKFLTDKETFRERIWNERAIELLGEEGARYYDLKRWHVAHLDQYKICYKMEFDSAYTYFNKVVSQEKVFEEKFYWAPIIPEATQIYEGFNQNPGW